MLWIDRNFNYNDQLARKYMKFKGEYYDIGTIAKIKGRHGPVLARFCGWQYGDRNNFKPINGKTFELYNTYDRAGVMDYCLEIVTPVKPNLQSIGTATSNGGLSDRDTPPSWEVEVGWIWYIVIMLTLTIFKARIFGWIATTIIFFAWKGGFLNGGKKK